MYTCVATVHTCDVLSHKRMMCIYVQLFIMHTAYIYSDVRSVDAHVYYLYFMITILSNVYV